MGRNVGQERAPGWVLNWQCDGQGRSLWMPSEMKGVHSRELALAHWSTGGSAPRSPPATRVPTLPMTSPGGPPDRIAPALRRHVFPGMRRQPMAPTPPGCKNNNTPSPEPAFSQFRIVQPRLFPAFGCSCSIALLLSIATGDYVCHDDSHTLSPSNHR